jgi:hypothetical protein
MVRTNNFSFGRRREASRHITATYEAVHEGKAFRFQARLYGSPETAWMRLVKIGDDVWRANCVSEKKEDAPRAPGFEALWVQCKRVLSDAK